MKQIYGKQYYLKNDGNLYRWDDASLFLEDVEYVVQARYYVTGEKLYQYATGSVMGDVRVVEAAYAYHKEIDGKYKSTICWLQKKETYGHFLAEHIMAAVREKLYNLDQIVTPSKMNPL